MAGRKNNKKTTSKKKKAPGKNLMSYIRDERTKKVVGLLFLLFAFFFLVSFISYLSTYKQDQSAVLNNAGRILTDSQLEVDNALGRLGAFFAHVFIFNNFGIAAFLLIPFCFAFGVNLTFNKRIFRYRKTLLYTILGLIWIAPTLAYLQMLLQPGGMFPWGGGFGNHLTGSDGRLTSLMGTLGTGGFLLIVSLAMLVLLYNISFGGILKLLKRKKSEQSEAAVKSPEGMEYLDEEETIFKKDQIEIEKEEEAETKEEESQIEPTEEEEPKEEAAVEFDPTVKKVEEEEEEKKDSGVALDIEEVKEEAVSDDPELSHSTDELYDPTKDLSNFKFPTLDLLEEHGEGKVKMDVEELERNKDRIIETLNNYKIEISKIKATIGPTVTLYEIVPAPGVRISKIKNLEDDIALSLAALGIRIIAPIPGKGTIGIEVPNEKKETVSMRSLLASEKFRNSKYELPIALGKTISNEVFIADLAKMPHLLVAGATGQGKSVGINAILVSLLYKRHPSQLKFVLVDPKKVELSIFSKIERHYLAKLPGEEDAIITDTQKVVNTLNALCIEMDERYELLKAAHVRNIKEYNKKFINRKLNPNEGHNFMPYIVLVIDEFADLMMTAGKEVETPVARLAQLARAIGIHLILATQRPSVNIITGTIKANFPARISFKVTSKVDSRTILDTGGAEQLIGRGDMLLSQGSETLRLQCGFVDTPEVDAVVDFIGEQRGYPEAFMLPEYVDESAEGGGNYAAEERDPLFEDAARLIVQNQMGSTSLIQRRMKLGYNRAGRLMDQLEDAGIVGPNVGSKARDVLFKTEAELEQYLNNLRET